MATPAEQITWTSRGYERFVAGLHAVNSDCTYPTPLPPPRRPESNGGLPGVEPGWYPPVPPRRGQEPLRDGCGYRDNPKQTPPVEAPRPSKPWWKIWGMK